MQARFEHLAGDRRGGVAAGAVFDEQHADDDARVQRRRERGEPGVGVARLRWRLTQPSAPDSAFGFAATSPELVRRRLQAVFSSAVPVLPATVDAGDRRRGARARAHHADHQATHGARHGGAHRRRAAPAAAAPEAKVGRGRCPPSATVAATVAICSGARQHLTLADRRRSDVEFALDLAGRRQRALGCARDARRVVEAEAFGRRHQARRAELHAERCEHRVAGHREGEFERAAAFLAVGVVQLDAVERGVGGVGEDRVRVGDVRAAARP